MGRKYLPSQRAMQVYWLCMLMVMCLGVILGLNARRVHPVLLGAYKAAWVVMLVVAVGAGWRWLWHTFPWWARLLPMLSLACIAVAFGQFPLLLGTSTQTEHAILNATDWVMRLGIFATLIGGFGVLVAVGLNQVRRE